MNNLKKRKRGRFIKEDRFEKALRPDNEISINILNHN